ncbi:MAG: PilZ domain-containing protein [Magnetococcales bacterium]|nr:PilZ domain-containing protein [Magnetococcales bacterium]MBF0157153.1 PilZ domain-containing protein [Magnetococcales bacterium]
MSRYSIFRRLPPGWRQDSRRRTPRFPAQARVVLYLDSGVEARGLLRDMSTGGAFVILFEPARGLMEGEEGHLGLDGPWDSDEVHYRFPCEVARVDGDGVALRFLVAVQSVRSSLSSS